jgi:two-component system, NtrC family, nitrogen regulation sensor histidine kinase NtrY
MASKSPRAEGLVFAVLLRAMLVAVLLVTLLYLVVDTRFYATALVVALCGALVVADLIAVAARAERAATRFLDALSAGALETPLQHSSVSGPLRSAYEHLLVRLRSDRRVQLQQGEYLQTLLDTVPAGLVVVDDTGALTIVNRAAHRLLGEPAPRLSDLPMLDGPAAQQLATLTPGAHQIVRLAGGRQLLASAAQFSTPDGCSRRLISLQRLAGDLDAVQLKAWDDMTRVLTHEMMNSLTPIASLSESLDALLRRGGSTEDVTAALETIARRSKGLMRFVERYRHLADLPAPQRQSITLVRLLDGVERLITPTLGEQGIAFESHVTPADLTISGDPDLLEQALINLLRNAADACVNQPQPQVRISCSVEHGQCFIDVIDNGSGITRADREQIFVPFFTTKPGGSGVGLSLARRIALSHGGQITVQSNVPCGSIFRLSLPA